MLPPAEEYPEVGFNYRMTDLQAAVGLVQLGRLDEVVARRRELAARYREALADVAGLRCVARPRRTGTTNYQSFWVEVERRPSRSTARRCWRTSPTHEHLGPARHHGRAPAAGLRRLATDGAAARAPSGSPTHTLILPLFHQMTGAEQDRVIAAVFSAADRGSG